MLKRAVLRSLVLLLAVGLMVGIYVTPSFAQGESITFTTYYPSPYGVYNQLQTNKLAVGDTNDDNLLTGADQPPANGQLYTARSVIFKPQSSLPAFDTREGELVYQGGSEKKFYFYDGNGWVAQAGGGTAVMYLSCPWNYVWPVFNAPIPPSPPNGGWGHCGGGGGPNICCTPAACPANWNSVATYAELTGISCYRWNLPDGDECGDFMTLGRWVRVCVK
jgi:hypothetical protein